MRESPYLQALRETDALAPPPVFPPWRIWEAVLVVVIFAASQPLASLVLSVALRRHGGVEWSTRSLEGPLFPLMLLGVVVVSHAVGWAALAWLIVRRHRLGFAEGLRLRRADLPVQPRAFRAWRFLLAGMGTQLLSVMLAGLAPPPQDLENPLLRFAQAGDWALALLFVLAVILAPLLEESLFRGLLLPALRRRLAFVPAALIVTGVFAMLHGVQTSGYWPALVAIGLAGYLMAWLRERTGSLWPPIVFHMGFNLMAILPLILLRGHIPQGWPA